MNIDHVTDGRRAARALLLTVVVLGAAACAARASRGHDTAPVGDEFHVDLATAGAGSPHYRIPALAVSARGTVLAAYDARPTLADLPSNIAVIVRRSRDHGRTWGDPVVVRRDTAPLGYGDPSFVVDHETGRIFLFYAASVRQGIFGSHTGNDERDPDIHQADLSWSDDDGVTWQHRRITAAIKRSEWVSLFASSGAGIQLRRGPYAGRLVQPYAVRIGSTFYAASALSDDHGATWRMGGLVGPGADENKVAELADGRLMLNSRAKPYRKVAWSSDGGASWTGWRDEPQLIDPANNGALIRWDERARGARRHWLLFSNTEHSSQRRNVTVKLSCDDGATWPVRVVVDTGPSAYSTIARLPNGRLGVLYERGPYTTIRFASLPMPRGCPAR
ncbi:MAG: sialidase family protein [Gemmatimonadota bacterium]|nr:sialidase family protein [Gemmatimonadota bacterium]